MLDTTKQALDHRLATEQHDRRVPSLVAAVVRDGVPLWSGGRGKVEGTTPTEDTQYRIGSITKTFVGVMIMRLRDEGMLSLSDPLRTHLQGTSFGDRTIGELLAHAAGITAEPAGEWWTQRRQAVGRSGRRDRPGDDQDARRAPVPLLQSRLRRAR